MKKIVSVMIILAVVFQAFIGFLFESDREIETLQTGAQTYCEPFAIPDDSRISDTDQLFSVLLKTAQETHTNLFRTYMAGSETETVKNDRTTVVKYSLLTGSSRYMQTFPLKNGRTFTPAETQSRTNRQFLDTQKSGSAEQVGQLRYHMYKTSLRIEPFYQMTSEVKGSGRYYVELPAGVQKDVFLKSLQKNLQQQFQAEIPVAQLQGDTQEITIPTMDEFLFECVYGLLLLLVVLSVLYICLRESKQIAVCKLHGVKTGKIMWLLLRSVFGVFAGTFLAVALGIGIYTQDFVYVWRVLQNTVAAYLFSIALIAVAAAAAVRTCRVYQNLNGKSGSKSVLYLNYVVKALSVLLILAEGQLLYTNVNAYQQSMRLYQAWSDARAYGVFYPLTHGSSVTTAEVVAAEGKIAEEVYPTLNRQGALYIGAELFQPEYLNSSAPASFPSVKVNVNYLKKYPLQDSAGKPVSVSENETSWVLLAPMRYKSQEQALRKELLETRQGMNTVDQEVYGVSKKIQKGTDVKIIWIADGQKVYTYNPKVSAKTAGTLSGVLVEVMTEQNSCISDRNGIRGNGDSDPLKVKLNGTAQETYDALVPLLKKTGVYENLPHLIATDQYMTGQATVIQSQINLYVLIAGFFLLMLWLTITQNMVILFDQNKKDLIVKKLFGWPAGRRFCKYMLPGLLVSLFVLCGYGVFAWVTQSMQWQYFLVISAVLLIVESLVSFVTIIRTETRKTVDTLKGDS
ncbi:MULTISPECIES: DUF1430 domain-containing protein [Caproicibacterium]|uniref:DUF1430 domain-containing protein n=1 Tax=Caproicibacterium argilliputei TaxID=3030016 RepID=A0AA97DC27_9FIRM|nr:DUF1430 domain-containing protein [Caproicibacterium argilliputei]WOC32691.1 DUF1430 domain-containing protein [Caproicibacterium argilliputei]